ncbi:MAG: hypothetical protein KBE85_08085 [Bacteroides sp.]|uniref:hypothetical protein n=1 Tax=Bacteroides sp. TaxID=29523 RepID=UPI001B657B79|nr:hypothetical protein [Bacteroides sp.]MBP9507863.1 hypothetical protein [Bacteroides sp.]MBP9587334.1 hypothetical protein [Bacteroides sp.]
MKSKGVLSSSFNMSLGFIPVIIAILLSEFITQDVAIYIGTIVGVVYSIYNVSYQPIKIPNFILYLSTVILTLLTLATFISGSYIPPRALPLTLEVSIFIPMMILFQHKRRFINYFITKKTSCTRRFFTQGAESSIVAARFALILGVIHFIVISIGILYSEGQLTKEATAIFYKYLPPTVFVLAIILNQIGIRYFNKLMSHVEYVPVVDTKGNVIGKSLAVEALSYKNTYINPVIRIAISVKGRVFLCNRSKKCSLDRDRVDYPMECYLHFNETLASGVKRVVKQTFPDVEGLHPTFNAFYHFENKLTNRLVYLFLLEIDDDSILCSPHFKEGKLWGFQQIEQNLNRNFFGECFEKEYEHLKSIIDIRERYKVS